MDTELLRYEGGALKALGDGRLRGCLVRFTGPDEPDLVGEYFTKETDLGGANRVGVYYQHGYDEALKNRRLAVGEIETDEVGAWIEFQLEMRDAYERAIYGLAEKGKLALSSGAVAHLVETVPVEGYDDVRFIKSWPVGEASITPTPADPGTANVLQPMKSYQVQNLWHNETPTTGDEVVIPVRLDLTVTTTHSDEGGTAMEKDSVTTTGEVTYSEPDVTNVTKALDGIAALLERMNERMEAREQAEPIKRLEVDKQSGPAIVTDAGHWNYDNYSTADLSYALHFLDTAARANMHHDGRYAQRAKAEAYKSLAYRLTGEEGKSSKAHHDAAVAVKSWARRNRLDLATAKANEIMQSTYADGGDEWIGVAYSGELWDLVRGESFVVDRLNPMEFPSGAESLVIPLIDGDVTVYKVAQSSALSANPGGIPTNTVTSSQINTGNTTVTLSKLGARSLYTGELMEDSVLPFASTLRENHATALREHLESAIIDGDITTTASTNINDIAGTPAATDYFLAFDGFRANALTNNSRDAGALTASDFLETAKKMGTAGLVGLDRTRCAFIMDLNTYWKALELPEIKTRDVSVQATIDNGDLTRIYGFDVLPSYFMHFKQPSRKANSAGKVDQDTAGNNTTGSIVCVHWQKWRFYWRRRMTMEVTRVPAADATEIVTLARCALQERDTAASAISYNITL